MQKIEHRTGVQAPAAVIWEVLEDVPGWASWNPLYPEASGRIGFGELLKLTVAIEGQPRRQIEARIVDWTPGEAIHWQARMLLGLVTAVRYMEIDVLGEENCIFSNGEFFAGMLGDTAARRLRPQIKRGFVAMGEALKVKAEAVWRERAGSAT